mmetsp:Transcript_31977/g.51371  ORF Transcript_31977/g.51371 Transcript_31977/m.51371 type:complete len:175 (-) Transcript_31977:919-1443(-)
MLTNRNGQTEYSDLDAHIPGTRADPFNLAFDKQFLEIDDEYEAVRTIQNKCYSGTKKGCFNFLSLVLGILLSFIWGLIMGALQFVLIWMIIPFVKVAKLYYMPAARVVGALLEAIFGRCCKNVASQGTTVNVNNGEASQQQNGVPLVISNVHPQQQQQYGSADGHMQSTAYPKI